MSIHITAGLSGTYNSALAGAKMVPEAKVTHVNTKTLSAAAGWQVKAANLRPLIDEAGALLKTFGRADLVKVPRDEIVRVLGH